MLYYPLTLLILGNEEMGGNVRPTQDQLKKYYNNIFVSDNYYYIRYQSKNTVKTESLQKSSRKISLNSVF